MEDTAMAKAAIEKKKPLTKTEIIANIVVATEMSKKDVTVQVSGRKFYVKVVSG